MLIVEVQMVCYIIIVDQVLIRHINHHYEVSLIELYFQKIEKITYMVVLYNKQVNQVIVYENRVVDV